MKIQEVSNNHLNIMVTNAIQGKIISFVQADIKLANEGAVYDVCNSPTLALEAQEIALNYNHEYYVDTLWKLMCSPEVSVHRWTYEMIRRIMSAPTRKVAEAVYITLSGGGWDV